MSRVIGLIVAGLIMTGCASGRTETSAERGYQAVLDQDWKVAEIELHDALRIDNYDLYSRLNLGVVYANTGRRQRAREQYKTVISTANGEVAKRTSNGKNGTKLADLARQNLAELN